MSLAFSSPAPGGWLSRPTHAKPHTTNPTAANSVSLLGPSDHQDRYTTSPLAGARWTPTSEEMPYLDALWTIADVEKSGRPR